MSYPLIQNPSPFQQLAQVIQGIQDRRAELGERGLRRRGLETQIAVGEEQVATSRATRQATAAERARQEQVRGMTARGIARILRDAPDPTSDTFGQTLRSVLAETSDPDAVGQISQYAQSYAQLHTLGPETATRALRLAAERDQINLDQATREIETEAVTNLRQTLAQNPFWRDMYAKVRGGLGPIIIAQMQAANQGREQSAQSEQFRRMAITQAIQAGRDQYRDALRGFQERQGYIVYGPDGSPVTVSRDDILAARTAEGQPRRLPRPTNDAPYILAALRGLAQTLGVSLADLQREGRQMMVPGSPERNPRRQR